MRNISKKFLSMLLVMVISVITPIGGGTAASSIELLDNEESVVTDDRIVPMRVIFESLGAEVTWLESGVVIADIVNDDFNADHTILQAGSNIMVVDEKTVILDTAPQIVDNLTMGPVQVVTETFGPDVDWEKYLPREEIAIQFGEDEIVIPGSRLVKKALPSSKYPNIDFDSFKSWMPYTALGRNNQCGKIAYSNLAYSDEYGLRKYTTNENEFTINGEDDFLVAMGNFYKEKGQVGMRFLIVTDAGSYTVRVSDEKADAHTDKYNMGQMKSGNRICILEFLVNPGSGLHNSMRNSGTVATGPIEVLGSPIRYIYRIYAD